MLAKSQVVAQFVSNVGGSQQGNGGTLALANEQANRTIQSTLSASVFQIAISEIKRLGDGSYQMSTELPNCR